MEKLLEFDNLVKSNQMEWLLRTDSHEKGFFVHVTHHGQKLPEGSVIMLYMKDLEKLLKVVSDHIKDLNEPENMNV